MRRCPALHRGLGRGLVLALALPLLAAGCASNPISRSRAEDPTARDLQEIKQRLVEIQRQATMTRVEVEELRRRVENLERATGVRPPEPRATRPPAASTAPPPARPAPSATTGSRRGEVIEEPAIRSRPERDFEESDLPPDEPPAGTAERPMEPPMEGPVTAPPATPPSTAGAGDAPITAAAQALYDRGYTLYHQGRYLDAEASFQRFLQAYGSTDLADNAQYWIGEARYARGDVSGALAAFREVAARYPQGNKVPDALLKAGQSLEELGDRETARQSYQQILDSYPNSAASVAAKDRLDQLP